MNLVELIDRYNSDDTCRAALERLRWPVGVACLRCGDMDVNDLGKHNRWECRSCHYQFSVTAGTIMHDSHLPLRKWFLAIYLMTVQEGHERQPAQGTSSPKDRLVSLSPDPGGDGQRPVHRSSACRS